jgi:glycosyltransferase involved in cell wall biosynthesis
MYNTLRVLSRMGFRVSFLTVPVLDCDPKYTVMLQGQGIECVYKPFSSSRLDKYLARFGADLDLVLLARPGVGGPWIDLVRKRAPRARIIYDTVDLHFLRFERQAKLDGSRARLRRAADSRRIETEIMRKADATLVRSTVERALIQSINPGIRSILYPLAREIPEMDTPRPSGRAGLLFVGGFNHSPNRDAVRWFVQEVFPLVRACRPATEFTIVGSKTPEEIRRLEGNGIKVLGYLKDLTPVYQSARVVVAPLRYGAGIKGKVVEAMLHGVPCVTTSVGAEGMSAEAGRDLLVCDSPRDMVDQIVRLLDEDALWEDISQSGFRFARNTFSMEASLLRLVRLFSEIGLPPGAGHCPVCGQKGPFLLPDRVESGLDLVCPACSAGPGLRMGAQALLDDLFPGKCSIKEVLASSAGTIIGHRLPDPVLRRLPGVRRMEEALEAPPTGRIQPVGIIHYDPEGKSPLDGSGLSEFSAVAGEMGRLVFVVPYDPAHCDTVIQKDGTTYGRNFLGYLKSADLEGECLWRARPETGVIDTRVWIAWRA